MSGIQQLTGKVAPYLGKIRPVVRMADRTGKIKKLTGFSGAELLNAFDGISSDGVPKSQPRTYTKQPTAGRKKTYTR